MSEALSRRVEAWARRWPRTTAFVAVPASVLPFAVFRIGIAAVLLLQAAFLCVDLPEFFGGAAVVSRPMRDAITAPALSALELDGVVERLESAGISRSATLRALLLVYASSLVGLLVGWRTRIMALVAWWFQLSLLVLGQLAVHGASAFAHIALFYCLWLPVGGAWSLDRRQGRADGAPTPLARIGLRAIQAHLCIVYFQAGAVKLIGEPWQTGEAAWLALFHSGWIQADLTWLAHAPWISKAATGLTLAIELSSPILIWPRLTRRWWAFSAIAMHAGFAVGMGLWVFAAIMIVFLVSSVLVSSDDEAAR